MPDPREVERLRAGLASLVLISPNATHALADEVAAAMIAAGVWLPPEGAELEEWHEVPNVDTSTSPWPSVSFTEDEFGGLRAHADGEDVTQAYSEWLLTLPTIHRRAYAWRDLVPVCPECQAGKHDGCSDLAVNDADEIVGCRCDHA